MDDDAEFDLVYVIEGYHRTYRMSVSYNDLRGQPVKADILRQTIFERRCRGIDLGVPDYENLALFKVNVDPNVGIYLPLLKLNSEVDAQAILPSQTLREIWEEQPAPHQIHILVTFIDLPGTPDGRRKILEAAHIVFDRLWGKVLDDILETVPDCNIKYLTEVQVKSLFLRGLFYGETTLLVREEYKVALERLASLKVQASADGTKGTVVIGQPGIGKTCFLYYLLFCLLAEKQTVAFQQGRYFVLFQNTGVRIEGTTFADGLSIPHGTWALTDSMTHSDQPCEAFLCASTAGDAWVVQTTSPSPSKWASWAKSAEANMYWMDVVPFNEMYALGKIQNLNLDDLRNNYRSWGPSARLCLSLTKNSEKIVSHKDFVSSAANDLTGSVNRFDDVMSASNPSHKLFVARPADSSRRNVALDFGTNHIRNIVARAYANHDHAVRLSFYKMIRGHAWFSSPAGQIFEIYMLLWFWHSPAEDVLPCTGAVAGSPPLEIPACPGNLTFFHKPEELMDIGEPKFPICLVPVSPKFPTLDAVVITNDAVITVQITISSKHDAKRSGFDKVYKNLPPGLRATRPLRCHVFLTDNIVNANSLREQNRKEIPPGTYVYSAVVDSEGLDLIPVTEERVLALEKARECPPGDAMEAD